MVCIFDPACELLPPWKKELYFTRVLMHLGLYCTFSLTSFPLPLSLYVQCVTVGGGVGGGGGVEIIEIDTLE